MIGILATVARAGLRRIAPAAARLAGRAARALTKGKLIGQGGGREAARTLARGAGAAAGTALTAAAVRDVVRGVRPQPIAGQPGAPYEYDPETGCVRIGKRYRRMNPANGRALRRAMRRIEGAEKVFRKVFKFKHGKAPTNVRMK